MPGAEIRCFVIMPFGNPQLDEHTARRLDRIYNQWIKPAVEELHLPTDPTLRFVCHRADQSARPSEIITHVIDQLATAEIVIADLSGRNPNVFYELGVRHAVNSNTILITNDIDDVPFD